MTLPNEYQTVMPYLLLDDCKQFVAFSTKVFNAKERIEMRAMRDEQLYFHGEIKIGDSTIMFLDTNGPTGIQVSSLFIYVENADETYALALKEGAASVMELCDQPYGRTCGIKDPLGNTWWITSIK